MKRKEYTGLGELVYEAVLSSGLQTRVVVKSGFSKAYAFLAVDYGSIDTDYSVNGTAVSTPKGVAHYLEHKMFDLPDGNAMQLFAKYGGSPNAFTSYDMTAYYVECTENVKENLELLLRMVTTPFYTKESVDKEQGIIAQEIQMYEDSAESKVFENLFENLYASHPIRWPIAGTVESIRKITAETLYECHRTFYTPENMMLVVVGDVNPSMIMETAERVVSAGEKQTVLRNYGSPETMLPSCTESECSMEIAMPTFAIGFKSEPAAFGIDSMRQEIVGDLAAEILAGESSLLYESMYEKNLIDSAFSIGYEGLKQASALTAGGDSLEPQAVLDALLEEAQRIGRDGLDEDLFYRLKKSSIGRRIRNLDSFESICYRICAYHFEGVDYFEFPEIYHTVTPEETADFLRRTVVKERAAISVIRPTAKEVHSC